MKHLLLGLALVLSGCDCGGNNGDVDDAGGNVDDAGGGGDDGGGSVDDAGGGVRDASITDAGTDAAIADAGTPFTCAPLDFPGTSCSGQNALATGPGGVIVMTQACDARVRVHRFVPGAGWEELPDPGAMPLLAGSQTHDVAVDSSGRVVLAYVQRISGESKPVHVLRFDGTSWAPVGPAHAGDFISTRLVLDGTRVFVATYTVALVFSSPLRVHRIDDGDAAWFSYPGDPLLTGLAWDPFALALDAAGEPVVAWTTNRGGASNNLDLVRFVPSSGSGTWTDRRLVMQGAHNPELAMDGDIAYVVYTQDTPGSPSVTVLRRVDLAGTADTTLDTIASDGSSVGFDVAMARIGTQILVAAGGQTPIGSTSVVLRAYDESDDATDIVGASTLNALSRMGVVEYEGQMLIAGQLDLSNSRLECFPIP